MPHSAPTPAPLPSIPLRVCGARPPWHRLGVTCCAPPLPPPPCGPPPPAPRPPPPLGVGGAPPPWHRLGVTCCARPLPPRWCGAEPARDGVRPGSHPPPSTEGGFIMPSATRRALRSGYWFALAAFSATAAALPAPAQAQTPTPVRGGTLSLIAQPEPPLLVSAINSQGPTLYVAGKIYQGLLRYGPDLNPLPELAKSWPLAPDGLTYTFELESGVKWHDGNPLTT